MEEAFNHYKAEGYAVYDVSNKRGIGYDILCERPGSTKYVEAKVTISNGWGVYVTYTEVDAAKSKPIDLFIVNKIQISVKENEYKCVGTSHETPGYVFSRQVPPTRSAFS